MNLFKITLYPALKKHFFDLLYNINCDAREYVGCTNVNKYFDIEKVERQQLVDVGLGVKISRPVMVERGLKSGDCIFSSLSHNGILAIYCYESGNKYQLTDLVKERQIEINMESFTHTGFYDESMVVLIDGDPLGVCSVEEMFMSKSVSVLKSVGDVEVNSCTDVSLLHSTRALVFASPIYILYEYNVDTEVMRELDIGKKIFTFASLTGIDVGVKGVFMECGNNFFTRSLSNDNSTSVILEFNPGTLCTFIPSSSDPRDIKKGMKIYSGGSFFTNTTERAHLTTPFKHRRWLSIVGLYRDIFLVYDDTSKWCLVKILVP